MDPVDLNVAVFDSTAQPQQIYLAVDYPDFQKYTPLQNRMRERHKANRSGSLRDRCSMAGTFFETERLILLKISVHLSLTQEHAFFWVFLVVLLQWQKIIWA